jgi:hypothetical protein
VERGVLDDDQFRNFVFADAATMYRSMNPHFFDGTAVESAVSGVA